MQAFARFIRTLIVKVHGHIVSLEHSRSHHSLESWRGFYFYHAFAPTMPTHSRLWFSKFPLQNACAASRWIAYILHTNGTLLLAFPHRKFARNNSKHTRHKLSLTNKICQIQKSTKIFTTTPLPAFCANKKRTNVQNVYASFPKSTDNYWNRTASPHVPVT